MNKLRDPLELFPDFILFDIFKHLSPVDWLRMKLVSKRWRTVFSKYIVWNDTLYFTGIETLRNENKTSALKVCFQNISKSYQKLGQNRVRYIEICPVENCELKLYLRLLRNPNNIQRFAVSELNLNCDHIIDLPSHASIGLFYEFVGVQKMKIIFSTANFNIDQLLMSQRNLEHLDLSCDIITYKDNNNTDRIHQSVKWIEIRFNSIPKRLAPYRIVAKCPNIEHFGFYPSQNVKANFQDFAQNMSLASKMKFLALSNLKFAKSSNVPVVCKWPSSLECLIFCPEVWSNFCDIGGNLEGLQHIAFGYGIDIERFLRSFQIGKSLRSLALIQPKSGDVSIWKYRPSVELLDSAYSVVPIDEFIGNIIHQFPRLRIVRHGIGRLTFKNLNRKRKTQWIIYRSKKRIAL